MKRSKKFIFIALLAVVVLAGSIGGVVFAQTQNGDGTQTKTLIDRVAEILVSKGVNVTSQQLNDAFTQARTETRDAALDKYLEGLVGQGKIDQSQAEQYREWLKSKPDVPIAPGFGGRGMHPGFCGPGGGFNRWGGPPPTAPQNS